MPSPSNPLATILGAAESALGVMYQWGGNSLASGVDCSGLVQQAYRAAGYQLPRVSNQQAQTGAAVAINDLQPGDLVYWDNSSRNAGADHIAIYIGNGLILEAYKTGEPIRVAPLAGGRRKPPTGARRIIGAVTPHAGVTAPVTLGPNQDRQYTTAAVSGGSTPMPAPTVSAASPSLAAAPEGGLGDDLPPNSSPEQVEQYIRNHYPQWSWLLTNPEIRSILMTPDINEMDQTEIQGRIAQTEYWKTHSEQSRQFDYLLGTDPLGAGAVIDRAKNTFADLFARNGIQASEEQIGEAAKSAIRRGWMNTAGQVVDQAALDDFVTFALGNQTKGLESQLPAGEQAYNADQLQAIARQYLVPLTRKQIEQWALDINSGKQSKEAFTSWMTGLSKARFANQQDIVAALESGMTPSDYFQGHIATIARTLELDDSQIDLNDPRWSWAMETVDKNGNRRAPTLGEVAQAARERPEFSDTRAYKEQESQYAMRMSEFFGVTA